MCGRGVMSSGITYGLTSLGSSARCLLGIIGAIVFMCGTLEGATGVSGSVGGSGTATAGVGTGIGAGVGSSRVATVKS